MTELVQEREGGVVVLRLHRPEARNALSAEIMDRLGAAVLAAEAPGSGVGAVVLTGTGDRAFCAGMDLRSFAAGDAQRATSPEHMAAFTRLLAGDVAVPLVGAANGSAVAGGLELLLACDVIVVADHASFGLPEVQRGLFAAGGGTTLGRRIPLSVALELLLTGDRIDATRALAVGLVNQVVPGADVLPTALAVANRIAANGPLGLRATKELARLAVTDPSRYAERWQHWQQVVFSSEDAREGATAFVEKRDPVWKGR
jgi:enoyl-CoA hydratase